MLVSHPALRTGSQLLSDNKVESRNSPITTQNLHHGTMESASAPPTNRPPNDPSPHGYPHSQAHQARQQRPAPAQTMNGVNGANMAASGGGGGGGGALPAGPAPAGHQAELNYIYGMVEELSKQLADNRRVTEDIVSGLGRVRTRAKSHDLSNEALIDAAAPELERTSLPWLICLC